LPREKTMSTNSTLQAEELQEVLYASIQEAREYHRGVVLMEQADEVVRNSPGGRITLSYSREMRGHRVTQALEAKRRLRALRAA